VLLAVATVVVPLSSGAQAQARDGQTTGRVIALPSVAAAKAPAPQASGQSGGVGDGGAGSCSAVVPRLAQYARSGLTKIGCMSSRHSASSNVTGLLSALPGNVVPSASLAGLVWCSASGDNQWWYTRFSACVSNSPVTYTEINTQNGAVLGTATLSVSQDIELSATKTAWNETDYVGISAVSGQVSTLELGFTASCASPCTAVKASPWIGLQTIGKGGLLSGTTTLQDAPSPGPDSITPDYQIQAIQPGTTPIQEFSTWADPVALRCDNLVGSSAGCVVPAYTPAFDVSLSQWGAAAATYDWAQYYLPDHWGEYSANKPLHRLASAAIQQTNRNKICDATWKPDPNLPTDSCDEFSFAATYESGGMLGLTGTQCAEIEPVMQNGQWYIKYINTVTGNERCVRGHVPSADNTGVGGDLGRFGPAQRILDLEAYWLQIVS
jgi:hypothetical protein